jgi:hypothetical protein
MQAVPKSECAANTMRSADTPAPEDGSKPAIVRTVFMDKRKKMRKSRDFPEENLADGRAKWVQGELNP